MSVDELAVMPRSNCILMLSGVRPFQSKKYDITKHENYGRLSDDNPKNAFVLEDYWRREERRKENELRKANEKMIKQLTDVESPLTTVDDLTDGLDEKEKLELLAA